MTNMVLTEFAIERHFDPSGAGTVITDRTPEKFQREARQFAMQGIVRPGYAPFCRLMFLENWTGANAGVVPITPENWFNVRSEYKARTDGELSVLVRYIELPTAPKAKYLCLVLYSREQLAKEDTIIDAEWGIVSILGQLHNKEEPMTPMTAMRNALGVDEGGSGVPLDRKAYQRSVEFWNTHVAVKVT